MITARQGLLNSEGLAAQLAGQRLRTSVFLVKALGGDWQGAGTVASKEPAIAEWYVLASNFPLVFLVAAPSV